MKESLVMKNKKMLEISGSVCIILALAALILGTVCSSPTLAETPTAEKPIVLKYATLLPESHAHSLADINWMNKIEKETQGRIKFQRYFGGTLLSPNEGYTELADGVADVAWFSRISKPAGYDLGLFMETAFMLVPSECSLRIMDQLCQKFPQIIKEYSAIKPLVNPTILGEYQLLSTKPVRKLEDIKGLTVNCPGEAYIQIIADQGGSAVSMGPPDWYMALQKSTIDGILLFPESLDSMKFSEVIKYITIFNFGDGPEINRGMNWKTWNKLPADIQEIFESNIDFLTDQVIINFKQANAKGLETAKKRGVIIIKLPPAQMKKLRNVVVQLQDQKAAKLDTKKLPATEILKEIRRLTDEYSSTTK
jgi:TRAP-type C4-dicarboxylate transport system substrate-binding protein